MLNSYSFYLCYCVEYRKVIMKAVELGYPLPSIGQQIAQDLLMRQLISSGIFAAMDLIYIMQNDCGIDFARINWKNPSAFNVTFPTLYSPKWHKNLGVSGTPDILDTNPFYADTGFIPATHGVNFTQNLAAVYVGNLSGYGGFGYTCWAESGTTNTNRIFTYLFDGQAGYGCNNPSQAASITAAQSIGLIGNDRLASNSARYVVNGTGVLTNSSVAAARSTNSFKLFGLDLPTVAVPTVASPNFPIQCFMVGAALSGALQTTLSTYLVQYKSTMITTATPTTVGAGSYTVPNGITEITVECWGGGGAGKGFPSATATRTGGGGGGGAYAKSVLTVTPGAVIPYTIGAGGTGSTGNGNPGADTSWNSGQILAKAGTGAIATDGYNAPGGQASACVGDVKYSGGAGGFQGPSLASSTGSGGSAAGALGPGFDGINGAAGVSVAVRPRQQLLGPGSAGVSQGNTYNGVGSAGTFGSGGSGARRTSGGPAGGKGGDGYIRISYTKQY